MTVEQAIQALTVRSANDAAVVLAERLAGSEEAFAAARVEHQKKIAARAFGRATVLAKLAQEKDR